MEELKTCPFCGGEAYLDKATEDYPNYVAGCKNCRVHTAWHSTKNGAVITWNTRPDNWISVEDRLPKIGEMVLTCTSFGEIAMEYYQKTLNGFTDKTAPSKQDVSYYVTHWQPLPEPPKGVE